MSMKDLRASQAETLAETIQNTIRAIIIEEEVPVFMFHKGERDIEKEILERVFININPEVKKIAEKAYDALYMQTFNFIEVMSEGKKGKEVKEDIKSIYLGYCPKSDFGENIEENFLKVDEIIEGASEAVQRAEKIYKNSDEMIKIILKGIKWGKKAISFFG